MNSQTVTLCHSPDAVFEQLLDEITNRIQAGNLVAAEDYAASHPEYSDRLKRLLPAMQALLAFGQSQSTATEGMAGSTTLAASGVLGDFRIIRELGRGGMGVVYEAEQISIGRQVALKVLPFASMLDERRLARFRNEVRAAGQLHHTNIVPVYAVGSDRGVHFYAMQLVGGQSLSEIIAAMKPGRSLSDVGPAKSVSHVQTTAGDTARAALSTLRSSGSAAFYRTAAQLAVQAAEALEHAHSCGVVHRDIKPSNLLVDERGSLWLTDFGLASVESGADLTMTGDLLGTLRYMSPEQTRGSGVVLDHRTDIYSLGATFYELLTLRPAFDAADRGELLKQITNEEPRAPHRIDPAIPDDLETIVLKAMSKDVSSRYTTAQHMADDLRRFLENKPIEARRPSPLERGRKWVLRHSALVAITAGSLAIVAVVGVAATLFTLRAYRSEAEQRVAAEDNLAVASQIIDRLLSHEADDKYYQGDLQHAETLAADASKFYEELLKHSDDPDLRFRAANAQSGVAHIWEIVGRHEKAGLASRRASELLERLTTQFPGEPRFLAALASNYNQMGIVDWSLNRPIAAEPAWRQAWEIWTELTNRFPDEPKYQDGVARMLANLGCICYFTDRFDVAEEYYRRAEAINKNLPESMRNSADGLATQAGSITNQAELARLRGQYNHALGLLEAAIPFHKKSLDKWPTNPIALDCYFHTHWNIVECNLGAHRPAAAAAAVERLVETFPDRLSAYAEGSQQLLRCADLSGLQDRTARTTVALVGATSLSLLACPAIYTVPNTCLVDSDCQVKDSPEVENYRRRAHGLITKGFKASNRSPDSLSRFAWFLLTCDDKSFRDTPHALEFARTITKDVPDRADAGLVLSLALYRNGELPAAEGTLQKVVELSPNGESNPIDWILLAMIRTQQGRLVEASGWRTKVHDWAEKNGRNKPEINQLVREISEQTTTPGTKP